ncbi:MAG: hypothetical protein PHH77_04650 [Victivallaceae bacterium]|nr:hypothetical protein [Victivallaceae bacterium]
MTPRKKQKRKKPDKLVARYVHTLGFSRLAGKNPEKKNVHFIRNRVVLAAAVTLFMIPGIYFCCF